MSTTAPATLSICPHCKVELLPWAKFCLNCGRKLTGFKIDLSPRLIYVRALGSTGSAKVVFTIRNSEILPLQIDDIQVSIPGWVQLPPFPIVIDREEQLILDIDANRQVDGGLCRLDFTINATGLEKYTQTLRLFISEPPKIETQVVVSKAVIDAPRVSVKPQCLVLKVVSGAAEVMNVRSSDPWVRLDKLDLPQLLVPPPAAVSEFSELKVHFGFNEAALVSHTTSTYPAALESNFYMRLTGGVPDLDAVVKVPIEYSPQLSVKGATKVSSNPDVWRLKPPPSRTGIDIKAGFEVAYDAAPEPGVPVPPRLTGINIDLENVGSADWTATDIELLDAPAGVSIVNRPAVLTARGQAGRAAGESFIRLRVDGNAFRLQSAGKIRIRITGASLVRKTTTVVEVPIELRGLAPFDGVVAIDFGTTNSTCAKAGKISEKPEMLSLGGKTPEGKNKNSVPTVVFYDGLAADGQPVFLIGEEAEQYTGVPDALVLEVKRRLGSRHPITVRFASEPEKTASYLPEEVAGHFLRAFKSLIELELGCTVKECLITHPVVFLEPQVNALRRAFELAGFKPLGFEQNGQARSILFEPMGAALDFMFTRAGEILEENSGIGSTQEYDVGIFDFGGGTTDFTAMHVLFRRIDTYKVALETRIDAMGGATFGGHNVTLTIARHFFKQWKEDRERQGKSGDMPFEIEDIRKIADGVKRGFFAYNRNELMRIADKAKIFLSNHDGGEEGVFSNSFYAQGWSDEESHRLELTESGLSQLIEKDISDLVDSFEEMIGTTKKRPDVVVVSGNSSRLKLVPAILSQRFGTEPQYVPPIQDLKWFAGDEKGQSALDNLKDGVVTGIGTQYIMTKATVSYVFMDLDDLPGIPPVLARRVGINGYANKRYVFHEVFKKDDTVPKEWTHVAAATLNRNSEIMILTTGSNKRELPLTEDHGWNSHIKFVGSLNCADFPTDCCPNEKLRKMRLIMSVDSDRKIHVRVQDPQDVKHFHDVALLPDEIFD